MARKPSNRKRSAPTATSPSNIPHSWPVSNWPQSIYPNDTRKGHYLVRVHAPELLAAGALVRIGRERVVIGAQYVRWMAKAAARVPGYELAVNRDQPTA